MKHLHYILFSVFSTGGVFGRRGRDHTLVGFTTTCAISAYHH